MLSTRSVKSTDNETRTAAAAVVGVKTAIKTLTEQTLNLGSDNVTTFLVPLGPGIFQFFKN